MNSEYSINVEYSLQLPVSLNLAFANTMEWIQDKYNVAMMCSIRVGQVSSLLHYTEECSVTLRDSPLHPKVLTYPRNPN